MKDYCVIDMGRFVISMGGNMFCIQDIGLCRRGKVN